MRYCLDSENSEECIYRGFFKYGEKSDKRALIKWGEDCQCEGSWIADQMVVLHLIRPLKNFMLPKIIIFNSFLNIKDLKAMKMSLP